MTDRRIVTYRRLLTSLLAVGAAIYELITGEKAPKAKDVL
jgi:hypothetical protein